MAEYKVPQDVEAEDKLIGPFGFRQFIYLIIAGVCALAAYFMFRIFPPMVVVPLPIIGFMLLLALPLRKDQPMETYLLAVYRFYTTPRQRIWNPSGTISYIDISAPKTDDIILTKDYTGKVASQKLEELSTLMDTRGWSSRGVSGSTATDSLNPVIVTEAATAVDVMDETTKVSKSFDEMLEKKNEEMKAAAIENMQKTKPPEPPKISPSKAERPAMPNIFAPERDDTPVPEYNPYPKGMVQRIIPTRESLEKMAAEKLAVAAEKESTSTVTTPVSPRIMDLATNPQYQNMSISALANEASRLEDKTEMEVVISHKKGDK